MSEEAIVVLDYPDRAALIVSVLRLLKAARRPLLSEHVHVGLDDEGKEDLQRIADELVRHLHFEHLPRKQIEDALYEGVRKYRGSAGQGPSNQQVAAAMLDALARAPMERLVYLGISNLKLPHGTVVGEVKFVEPSQDPELVEAFENGFARKVPTLLCEIAVTAGTDDLLFRRARSAAEVALGLVRQHNLFGFMAKIYLEQLLYGFDGSWAWRDGSTTSRVGWRRESPLPLPMEHGPCVLGL